MNDFYLSRESYLKKIKNYIARMPSLSTTVIKVLETCNDPMASASDLKMVISLDPVLTGRVLKLINSAYYSLGQSSSSLTRAIVMLGVNTVKNLALSFTIMDSFKGKGSCLAFSVDEFWRHSLCVGVVAKSLATFKGAPATEQETFFVAGLLHDLGKIPLRMQFPEAYQRICDNVHSGQKALCRIETGFLGFDHATVGSIIAEKWRLGSTLVESLSHHHNPADGSEKHREFVSIVALANLLTLYLKIGNAGDRFIDFPKIKLLLSEVGMDWPMLNELQDTVPGEIERAKIFLEVVQDG